MLSSLGHCQHLSVELSVCRGTPEASTLQTPHCSRPTELIWGYSKVYCFPTYTPGTTLFFLLFSVFMMGEAKALLEVRSKAAGDFSQASTPKDSAVLHSGVEKPRDWPSPALAQDSEELSPLGSTSPSPTLYLLKDKKEVKGNEIPVISPQQGWLLSLEHVFRGPKAWPDQAQAKGQTH